MLKPTTHEKSFQSHQPVCCWESAIATSTFIASCDALFAPPPAYCWKVTRVHLFFAASVKHVWLVNRVHCHCLVQSEMGYTTRQSVCRVSAAGPKSNIALLLLSVWTPPLPKLPYVDGKNISYSREQTVSPGEHERGGCYCIQQSPLLRPATETSIN